MTELLFKNARMVLPNEVVDGSLGAVDGLIKTIASGPSAAAGHDCEGDYLFPGLVELHTDHLENHYAPRPQVFWNPVSAVQAHDAQIACSGITTVFDALRIGLEDDAELKAADMQRLAQAIETGQSEDRLRADHFIHLRCEVSAPHVLEEFEYYKNDSRVRLLSLMDHTPGQRQFTSLEAYEVYYKSKKGFSDAEMQAFIVKRQEQASKSTAQNRIDIAAYAKAHGVLIASHDDATSAHVEEAVSLNTTIAEFPTTLEAAEGSRAAGMKILMGAPNVVRGGSHSGNISARELAETGNLDILSSDYVPVSLIQGVFQLTEEVEALSLPQAAAMVTSTPAQAVGLNDRGALAMGRRADLVQVRLVGNVPIIRGVWREGVRVA